MTRFLPGEIVNITITGGRIDEVSKNGIHVVLPNGTTATVELSNLEAVTVERVAPAEWPPQPGDLWRTERQPYFAMYSDGAMVLVNLGGERFSPDFVLAHGSLTLVHREEQDGGEVR
ncbi:hypothetical protein SAMN04489712_105244 [Thermomonospora echinospora]|uniref:Uncharacterized protein n=1 Tax=Thermomonospora echinospora TaxID=1992 RepID=A0A1H6A8D0_9ACTN|nr:hypothetical protein [Thermomonospora echinospora]SEG44295.1 hypothetical protein SAMN04489712_105244 [Thermomonospora echinospora]